MPKRTTDFREDLLADLADAREAADYLNAAVEDSEEMVLVALRDIAEARQMARVAGEAGVAREALYRMLRKSGNPTYCSLMGILNSIGLRMVFTPATSTSAPRKGSSLSKAMSAAHAKSTITGLKNGAILQGAPKTHSMNSTLGSVPKRAPAIEQRNYIETASVTGALSIGA